MARTKQTARKATGGMAPRKVAAKLKKAAKDSAAEPTPAMPPAVATTPNSSGDEAESKKRTPQNGTPGDKESAASPVQPKPILVGASDDDAHEQGAAGAGVSRDRETKPENVGDGEEVVEMGWVSAWAYITTTPAAPKDDEGNWGPAQVSYFPCLQNLNDSQGQSFGQFVDKLLPTAIYAICYAKDWAITKIDFRMQLEPRTKLDGDFIGRSKGGSFLYQVKIRVSFTAARKSVASIRAELMNRGIFLTPQGTHPKSTPEDAIAGPLKAPDASKFIDLTKDEPEPASQEPPRLMVNLTPSAARSRAQAERSANSSAIVGEITSKEEAGVSPQNKDHALVLADNSTKEPMFSAQEFEQQTSKERADYRLEQCEEMELPHPTKAQSPSVETAEMDHVNADRIDHDISEEVDAALPPSIHSSSPTPVETPHSRAVENPSQTTPFAAATVETHTSPLVTSPSASRVVDDVMEDASQTAITVSAEAPPASTVMPPPVSNYSNEFMKNAYEASAASVDGMLARSAARDARRASLLLFTPILAVDDEIMKDASKTAISATAESQPTSSRPIVTADTDDEHMKDIPQPPTTATARASQGDFLGQTATPQILPESHQIHQANENPAAPSTDHDEIDKSIDDFMEITKTTSIDQARLYLISTNGNLRQALERFYIPLKDHDEIEKNIDDFMEKTKTTSTDQARLYLIFTNGNLRQAVERFYKDHKAPVVATKETPSRPATSPSPPTLLEEALAAYSASKAKPRKERQRRGDTIVILDGADLSRNCRVHHSDLVEASSFFEPDLAALFSDDDVRDVRDVQGVRYLYILMHANAEMPTLLRKSLSTLRKDCAGEMYTVSTKKDLDCEIMDVITSNHARPLVLPASSETAESARKDATAKPQSAAQPGVGPSEAGIDWQVGYEDFFCIITRFRPKWFDNKNIASVIPKLEAVAHIANSYEAVNLASPVTTSLTDHFNRCIVDKKLWEAILTDAGRWLRLAVLLRNVSLYREAFIHVVGCFPEWPWTVQQADIPEEVLERIKIKSCLLLHQRREIERKLLLLTIYEQQLPKTENNDGLMVPVTPLNQLTAYNTVSLFGDWMRSHLAYLDTGSPVLALPSELCEHTEGVCLTVAGFVFDVHKGGNEYLSEKSVIENWNVDLNFRRPAGGGRIEQELRWQDGVKRTLKILKKEASKLVAPLAKRNLQVGEAVEYLTCIEVEDDDTPWEREVKGEDDGEDDMMD